MQYVVYSLHIVITNLCPYRKNMHSAIFYKLGVIVSLLFVLIY